MAGQLRDYRCYAPSKTTFHGRFIDVEPLDFDRHKTGALTGVLHPDQAGLWRYLMIGPYDEFAAFAEDYRRLMRDDGWLPYALVEKTSGVVAGLASYLRLRMAHGSIEVGGLVFSSRLQRTRAATEAMYLMARHIFEDLGYRRYEWKCNALNEASRCAALRLGFQFEGIFRNDMIVRGESRDTAWYSIIDTQWPECKAAFEAWLRDANFDEQGRQKQSLSAFRAHP